MKKSKDSRDVFAVFKPGSFMENASFAEKLKYWFKNVYWYHFKLATFVVIFLLFLIPMLISDIFFREYNDLDYVLAGSVFADSQEMLVMTEKMQNFVVTDDGQAPKIVGQMLCTRSTMGVGEQDLAIDEFASANMSKISVTMAEDEILLFFFDKKYAEWYAEQGAFEPLKTFGIESDNEYFIRVDSTPFFSSLNISHDDGIYAAIKVKTEDRIKDKRIVKKYENAARVLAGIVAGG